MKSKSHRKRHVPVGPAGVWFQTQQQQHSIENQRIDKNGRREHIDHEDDDIDNSNNKNKKSSKRSHATSSNIQSFHNLAWTAAQCSLGYATPNLSGLFHSSQKYSLIRRHVPKHFVLIREIHTTMLNNWKLRDGQKLLVMVNTMKAVMGDNYLWTVGLTDETGSSIQAWIQPSFVQKEQQRSAPQYLRVGVVWMLKNVTLAVGRRTLGMIPFAGEPANDDDDNDDDDMNTNHIESEINGTVSGDYGHQLTKPVERTLLISESNIEQVWSSASEKDITHETYVKWVEQRNDATLLATTTTADVEELDHSATEYLEVDADEHDGHPTRNSLMQPEGFLSSSTEEQEFKGDDDDTCTSFNFSSNNDFNTSTNNVEIIIRQNNMIADETVKRTSTPQHTNQRKTAAQKYLNPESFQTLHQSDSLKKPFSQSSNVLDGHKLSSVAGTSMTGHVHCNSEGSSSSVITSKKAVSVSSYPTNVYNEVQSIKENRLQGENHNNSSITNSARLSTNPAVDIIETNLTSKQNNIIAPHTEITVTSKISIQGNRISSTLSMSKQLPSMAMTKTKEPSKLWSSSHDSRLMAMLDDEDDGDDD